MKEYDFIFINGRFLEQKLTGVQRFAYETVKEMLQKPCSVSKLMNYTAQYII